MLSLLRSCLQVFFAFVNFVLFIFKSDSAVFHLLFKDLNIFCGCCNYLFVFKIHFVKFGNLRIGVLSDIDDIIVAEIAVKIIHSQLDIIFSKRLRAVSRKFGDHGISAVHDR